MMNTSEFGRLRNNYIKSSFSRLKLCSIGTNNSILVHNNSSSEMRDLPLTKLEECLSLDRRDRRAWMQLCASWQQSCKMCRVTFSTHVSRNKGDDTISQSPEELKDQSPDRPARLSSTWKSFAAISTYRTRDRCVSQCCLTKWRKHNSQTKLKTLRLLQSGEANKHLLSLIYY